MGAGVEKGRGGVVVGEDALPAGGELVAVGGRGPCAEELY